MKYSVYLKHNKCWHFIQFVLNERVIECAMHKYKECFSSELLDILWGRKFCSAGIQGGTDRRFMVTIALHSFLTDPLGLFRDCEWEEERQKR